MAIVKKTKEETELEEKKEEEIRRKIYQDKNDERNFQLEKTRIEVSSAARWAGITTIIEEIFKFPLRFFWLICVTIITVSKREIPDCLKDIYK